MSALRSESVEVRSKCMCACVHVCMCACKRLPAGPKRVAPVSRPETQATHDIIRCSMNGRAIVMHSGSQMPSATSSMISASVAFLFPVIATLTCDFFVADADAPTAADASSSIASFVTLRLAVQPNATLMSCSPRPHAISACENEMCLSWSVSSS